MIITDQKPERILIRVPNWIGDALMNLSAVRAVRRQFPEAITTVLAESWVADLYKLVEEVDDILVYAKKRGIMRPFTFFRAVSTLRKSRFDMAVIFQNAFEAAFMTALAGVPIRLGYDLEFRGGLLTHPMPVQKNPVKKHQMYYYISMLSSAGFSIGEPDFSLKMPAEILSVSDRHLPGESVSGPPCLGFNLGAFSGSAKRWPPDFFLKLLRHVLKTLDARILVFGIHEIPEKEREVLNRIEEKGRLKTYSMLPLLHLAGLISRCTLFITNDSGPMHLAASLGIPVVAIFGPTDVGQTGPLGTGHRIVQKNMHCAPCFQRECPEAHHACMRTLSPDDVYEAIYAMFAGGEKEKAQRSVEL